MDVSLSNDANLLDALPVHVVVVDSEGVILAVNAAWRRFAESNGLKSTNFGIGLNYFDACDQRIGNCVEQVRSILAGIRLVLRGERNEFVQDYLCHSPSEQRWFRLLVSPFSTGTLKGALLVHIDITERKKAEETLKLHKAMLASAVQIADLGAWEYDFKTDRLEWSDVALRIFGVQRRAFMGTRTQFFNRVHPEDRAALKASHAKALIGDGTFDVEYRIIRSDGEVRLLHDRGEVTFDNGNPIRSAGAVIDITERSRSEEALRQSEEKFRMLTEAIPNVAWTSRADGWITYCNRRWSDATGLSLEKCYGYAWLSCVHPDDRQKIRMAWDHAVKSGEVFDCENRMLNRDGTYHWMLTRAVPLRDSAGRILNWLGTSTDIDELKRATVALQQAKEAAEATSQAKSNFLANVSHEVRTPLNAIVGFTDLALNTPLDTEQREYLELVKSSASTLLSLVDEILDFSKMAAGQVSIESIEFNLRDTLTTIVRPFAVQAQRKGLAFQFQWLGDIGASLVRGDPTRLRQILANLIGNAIKFTEKGGVLVCVEASPGLRQEITLQISVCDTGIGIPPEKQRLIFEPFTQADASTTRKYGGTGLGLTIALQLTELMGGQLWMQNNSGQGCTFYLSLPLCLSEATVPLGHS